MKTESKNVNLSKALEIELKIRGASDKTIKSYVYNNKRFLNFIQKSSKNVTREDIRKYLTYLKLRGISNNGLCQIIASLKFYYQNVLNRKMFYGIKYPRRERKLPTILTKEEIKSMIDSIENKKHKLLIKIIYGSGLRVSEAVKLKVSDLDLEQRIIHVRLGKRMKDRNTILPKNLIEEIKDYLKLKKNDNPYLFSGRNGKHLSVRSAQKIVKKAQG
jgi:site-specific recombinase XerD